MTGVAIKKHTTAKTRCFIFQIKTTDDQNILYLKEKNPSRPKIDYYFEKVYDVIQIQVEYISQPVSVPRLLNYGENYFEKQKLLDISCNKIHSLTFSS